MSSSSLYRICFVQATNTLQQLQDPPEDPEHCSESAADELAAEKVRILSLRPMYADQYSGEMTYLK